MSLQLYQVDYKSYLLDFKSLVEEESQAVEISSSLDKSGVVEPMPGLPVRFSID